MKKNMNLLSLYAVSPVHAGSETSTGAIDNPIQRERHTNWPHIQANGVKGALRDHFRKDSSDRDLINIIFGSDQSNDKGFDGYDKDIHGCVVFSDAKLLAFPVRSNIAPFVHVTCPAVLKRFNTDMKYLGENKIEVPKLGDNNAKAINWDYSEQRIILEDAVVRTEDRIDIEFFNKNFPDIERLLVVSDQMFKYAVENCTEVQTQIKIDEKTGTASTGALRYSEYLPSTTLMYSVVMFNDSYFENKFQADAIKEKVVNSIKDFVQIGGDQTLGRGIFRVNWVGDKNV